MGVGYNSVTNIREGLIEQEKQGRNNSTKGILLRTCICKRREAEKGRDGDGDAKGDAAVRMVSSRSHACAHTHKRVSELRV
jgi:hypothetical protein